MPGLLKNDKSRRLYHLVILPIYLLSTTGQEGQYIYTTDVLTLNSKHPTTEADSHITEVKTPLKFSAWQACLRNHPDADFAQYILNGLQHGFHIGMEPSAPL